MLEGSLPMSVLSGIGVLFLILSGLAVLCKAFYVKVALGKALIVNDMSRRPKVYFTGGAFVYPIIYKKEWMDMTIIALKVNRHGKNGLICADNIRADVTAVFYLQVNETAEDVIKVAKSVGASHATDKAVVNDLFHAKFSEVLKTAAIQMPFTELTENCSTFRDRIIEIIGIDLIGYVLEDVAIDFVEKTPNSRLDADNIVDK